MPTRHRSIFTLAAALASLAAVAPPAAGQPTNTLALGEQYQGALGYDYGYGYAQSDCLFATVTGSGPLSAGGTCTGNWLFLGGIQPIIEINSLAAVDAGGLLHASVTVHGALPRVPSTGAVPYGYSAGLKVDASSDDFLTVTALGGIDAGASLVFELFLHGTATTALANVQPPHPELAVLPGQYQGDNAGAEGIYRFTAFTGADDEGFPTGPGAELVVWNDDPSRASPQTAHVVVPLGALSFAHGVASLRVAQWLEAYGVANGDSQLPGAVDGAVALPHFDVVADFANTAGIAGVSVIGANGANLSSQYALCTSARCFGVTATPEPATLALLGAGLALLAALRQSRPRRRNAASPSTTASRITT